MIIDDTMSSMNMDRKLRSTILDLSVHVILAIILVFFFRWLTDGWLWPVLAVTGEILIDVDHFLDYFKYYGKKFSAGDFFRHKYQKSGKCYIIFHSWEIVILLMLLSVKLSWLTPLAIGMAVHMLSDLSFSHRENLKALFLLYRWRMGFDLKKIKHG